MTLELIASCLILAAQTYHVPPAALIGIMHVEGGAVGQAVRNSNGTYDLGPMQVNTIWVPQLARLWNVDQKTATNWVRDNPCVNVHVSAWILRQRYDEAGQDLFKAIGNYHSKTGWRSYDYAMKVVGVMRRKGLIDEGKKAATDKKQSKRQVAEYAISPQP